MENYTRGVCMELLRIPRMTTQRLRLRHTGRHAGGGFIQRGRGGGDPSAYIYLFFFVRQHDRAFSLGRFQRTRRRLIYHDGWQTKPSAVHGYDIFPSKEYTCNERQQKKKKKT